MVWRGRHPSLLRFPRVGDEASNNRQTIKWLFWSPLDKFYYFFRDRDLNRPVRAQIDSALYGLQRASSGRRYGAAEFEKYEPLVPVGFRWWNAWSPTDPLGHRVDFYSPQLQCSFRYGLKGHTGFWKDPDFYDFAARWLEDGDSRALGSNWSPEAS